MRVLSRLGGVVNGWLIRIHWVILACLVSSGIVWAMVKFGASPLWTRIVEGLFFFVFGIWILFRGTWRGENWSTQPGFEPVIIGSFILWGGVWWLVRFRLNTGQPSTDALLFGMSLCILSCIFKLLNVLFTHRWYKRHMKNYLCPECDCILCYVGERPAGYTDRVRAGGYGTRTYSYESSYKCMSCGYES
jgi:hypothetical protein